MKYILQNDNFEVVGKQYLKGVGNYTGNTTNASDLAKVINNKADKTDIVTPDWNAAYGEAGYIENKPIIKNFIKEQSMEFSDVDEWGSVYAGYDAVPSNTTVAKVFADITMYEGEHITTTVIVKKGESVDILINKIEEWDYLEISMYDTSEGLTMNVSSNFGFGGTLKCYYYEEGKQLDEDYIPDTIARKTDIPTDIIKTTPQTLSDTDKNQALANLGIDPVVWKYMCNPFKILIESDYTLSGQVIPDDFFELLRKNPYVIALNCVVLWMCGTTNYYKPTEVNEDSTDKIALIFAGDKEVIIDLKNGI